MVQEQARHMLPGFRSQVTIRAFVAQEALDYHYDNPAQMFADLQQGGCILPDTGSHGPDQTARICSSQHASAN